MSWPTPQDYNEAIQNPRLNLADSELASGSVETSPLGLPKPITGNFASVYRLHCGKHDWAVRCFWRDFGDMQERYSAISRHLASKRLPFAVAFEYQTRGIRVGSSWFPILKMEWVAGLQLDEFIRRHLADNVALERLSSEWLTLVGQLEDAGVAHGDLQHGNVLVDGGSLKLVDYDGMFVPALKGKKSHELGHENYQHPGRTQNYFDGSLDRFSSAVIQLALAGLAADQSLWTTLSGGDECLLLRKSDFLQPEKSAALSLLKGIGNAGVASSASLLESMLKTDIKRLPSVTPARETNTRSIRLRTSIWRVGQRSLAPAAVVGGPSWLADHVSPSPRASFVSSPTFPRLTALVAAMAIVVLLVMLTSLPSAISTLVPILVLVLVVAAFVTLLAYALDPAVRELSETLTFSRRKMRNMAAADRAIRRLDLEESRALKSRERRLSRLERRKERLHRRVERDREDARRLARAESTRLEAHLEHLSEAKAAEMKAKLLEERQLHVERFLRKKSIWSGEFASVDGFGKARLWLRGVRCAADATSERIAETRGLGSHIAEALAEWRVECEIEARGLTPKQLSPKIAKQIALRYDGSLRAIENRRSRAASRLTQHLQAIDAYALLQSGRSKKIHDRIQQQCKASLTEIAGERAEWTERRRVESQTIESIARKLEPFEGITVLAFLLRLARFTPQTDKGRLAIERTRPN